ncbi:MAG: hypothetical protein CYPHOPRED_004572 [Cyphobasidiales sp. Tagirdzhanova-0007]|nr:MAG: hypothetical protein CYPHOPRED_004572 [Cyphobasidiales sp. Tagirdzhanova-0007]
MSIVVSKNAAADHPLTSLGQGASIDDVFSTDGVDPEKPMSCGIFLQKKDDEAFQYTYRYHEVKKVNKVALGLTGCIALTQLSPKGTIVLEDKATGIKITGKPGDVIKIAKGTTVTFSSPGQYFALRYTTYYGKAFYVGQRKLRDF